MAVMLARLVGFTLILLAAVTARAEGESYRRSVSFEWDPIEGAHAYELVIKPVANGASPLKFKPQENNWSGRLPPGRYEMTTRSLDERGVPGEWSPSTAFDVDLEKPVLLTPKENEKRSLKETESASTVFSWSAVGGAKSYEIQVVGDDGAVVLKEDTPDVSISRSLPVARGYRWKVRAFGPDGLVSESETGFSLIGAPLERPKFELPENDFVRELQWETPEYASTYDIEIHRFDERAKRWESVGVVHDLKESKYPVDLEWPGGRYQATVRAKADLRQPSQQQRLRFRLRSGDRSPASEFTAEIRKSIDRVNGWYGIASYLLTVISYSSTYFDSSQASATTFNATGGTGRLGLGYFLRGSSWGFLGIAELSGLTDSESQSITYAASELNAVWRRHVTQRTELRVQLGGFYKEQPVAIGNVSTLRVSSYSNVSVLGSHLGAEFWYSFSSKLGLQINAHLYQALSGLSTPNGQAVEPTLSSQVGFLGSYRLGSRATGLVGYARRDDRTRYGSTSGKSNDVEISGNYLNFFLEYGF